MPTITEADVKTSIEQHQKWLKAAHTVGVTQIKRAGKTTVALLAIFARSKDAGICPRKLETRRDDGKSVTVTVVVRTALALRPE